MHCVKLACIKLVKVCYNLNVLDVFCNIKYNHVFFTNFLCAVKIYKIESSECLFSLQFFCKFYCKGIFFKKRIAKDINIHFIIFLYLYASESKFEKDSTAQA